MNTEVDIARPGFKQRFWCLLCVLSWASCFSDLKLPHRVNGKVPQRSNLRLGEGLKRSNIWGTAYKYWLGLLERVYRIGLPGHVCRLELICHSCERGFKIGGKTEKNHGPVCERLRTHSLHKHLVNESLAREAEGKRISSQEIRREPRHEKTQPSHSRHFPTHGWLKMENKRVIQGEQGKASQSTLVPRCLWITATTLCLLWGNHC